MDPAEAMEHVAIRPATTQQDFARLRALMLAYGHHLATNPTGAVNICIPDYEREIAALPGPYAAPAGVLLLAANAEDPAGCVALKPIKPTHPIDQDERACEMKRLWVGDAFRGIGLGRRLIDAAIAWARQAGYDTMYLDTVPAAMPQANALYQRLGFEQIDRYNDNPVDDVIFFRLNLR